MLEGHKKFLMMDKAKKNNFYVEVNYEGDDQCRTLKVTFPNGDKAYVERKHFAELVFAIGSPTEQRKMIPQTTTKVRWHESLFTVKATKDIKKGESINFSAKLSCDVVNEEDVIGGKVISKFK